jgi:hypothetical protein
MACRYEEELTFDSFPYRLPNVPTTNDPIADVISERLMNALAAKWLDAHPAHAMMIMIGNSRAKRGC